MSLTFDELQRANVKRCEDSFNRGVNNWLPEKWMNALVGEIGEVANVLKKADRGMKSLGDPTWAEACELLAHELADVQCYLILLAARCGINLGEATREKFNIVSDRVNSPIKL